MMGRFRFGKMSTGIRRQASPLPRATATTATIIVSGRRIAKTIGFTAASPRPQPAILPASGVSCLARRDVPVFRPGATVLKVKASDELLIRSESQRGVPGLVLADHRVDDRQELPHHGGQGDFRRLP